MPSASPPNGQGHTTSPPTPGSSSPKTQTARSPSTASPNRTPNLLASQVRIDQILLDDQTPNRLNDDDDSLKELAQAIATDGLINPITLRNNNGRLEIIAGRRRLQAFKILGRTHIPATIRTTTDSQAATIKIAENTARSNLSPVEEATQLAIAVKEHPAGVDGVAIAIGRSINWVLDRLEMVEWPETLLAHVHTAKISLSAAKRLARIHDPEQREYYIEQAARCGINTATAALWLQDANSLPQNATPVSENVAQVGNIAYKTTTHVQCFRCEEWRELTTTTPARICNHCIVELGKAPTQVSRQTKEPEPSKPDDAP